MLPISPFIDRTSLIEQREIEISLARAIYVSATPLSITENRWWRQFFHKIRPAFQIPSRHLLSNSLLMNEKKTVHSLIKDLASDSKCITVSADGWSCIANESHIQTLFFTPEPIFFKSVHTNERRHTAEYIAECIIVAIQEFCKLNQIESERLKSLVTDNAANMVAAWKMIKEEFPNVTTYGCLAHGINLLVSDM